MFSMAHHHLLKVVGVMKQVRRKCARILLAFLCAAPSAALAQVLAIAPDGTVNRLGFSEPVAAQASAPCGERLQPIFEAAARRYDLSAAFIRSVAQTESNCATSAVSDAGAVGVMQLMPATAHDFGVDARDTAQNILGGAAYLRQQIDHFGGRLNLALAAYNAGPRAAQRYNAAITFPETRRYVERNLNLLADQSLHQTGTIH
jgi:soluble lytic murein transglycosylase-like protein